MAKELVRKQRGLKPSIYAMNNIAYNLITNGGMLLALFMVVFYDSFYPVEAFIFPYLLARYLSPLFSRVNPCICEDTVVLSAVLMSMLLFLQDSTIPSSEKALFGIHFGNKNAQQMVFLLFVLLLVLHSLECMWKKQKTLTQILSGLVSGGLVGYAAFSMCRTRTNNGDLLWFASRWILVILILFLIFSYIQATLKQTFG